MEALERLREILAGARRIVFFGGAGVSTGSGIPDFRSDQGLYAEKFRGLSPEMILSSSFFYLETETFFDFYRTYMLYPEARPNNCHRYLYELEKQDRLRGIVTQNVDGLHRAAGNIRVYELHGSVHENTCMECGERYSMQWMARTQGIARCEKCGGVVKPGIVLYGEAPDKYTSMGATREISQADTLIVAGTSLQVEPARSYLEWFRGKHLVVINRGKLELENRAELVMHEDVCAVADELLKDIE